VSDVIFDQSPHRVKFDWGWHGCSSAAARGEIVVIVDVLRFSTVCAAACARGISIVPAAMDEELEPLAQRHGATNPGTDFARLSPDSYSSLEPGSRIVVKSPNGATCATLSIGAPHVLFGAIVNATAVAQRVRDLLWETDLSATIIACGERWDHANPDGQLRFAIEDYLGAGAILSKLDVDKSAEAIVSETSFRGSQMSIAESLLGSASGRELLARSLIRDVNLAADLDLFDAVPIFLDGVIHCGTR